MSEKEMREYIIYHTDDHGFDLINGKLVSVDVWLKKGDGSEELVTGSLKTVYNELKRRGI